MHKRGLSPQVEPPLTQRGGRAQDRIPTTSATSWPPPPRADTGEPRFEATDEGVLRVADGDQRLCANGSRACTRVCNDVNCHGRPNEHVGLRLTNQELHFPFTPFKPRQAQLADSGSRDLIRRRLESVGCAIDTSVRRQGVSFDGPQAGPLHEPIRRSLAPLPSEDACAEGGDAQTDEPPLPPLHGLIVRQHQGAGGLQPGVRPTRSRPASVADQPASVSPPSGKITFPSGNAAFPSARTVSQPAITSPAGGTAAPEDGNAVLADGGTTPATGGPPFGRPSVCHHQADPCRTIDSWPCET